MICDICHKDVGLCYHTNKGRTVCTPCSWWWIVDQVHNELIEPDTIHITKDMWEGMGKHFGFIF